MSNHYGSVAEIYDILITGVRVVLDFETEGQANTFRTKLYKYKTLTERSFIDLELLDKEKSISMKRNPAKKERFSFIIQLVDDVERKSKYNFEIIDELPQEDLSCLEP